MFAVVEFVDKSSVAVVPKSWLIGDEECYWPRIPTTKTYASVRRSEERPEFATPHRIRIHKRLDNYDRALEAQDYLLDNSSLLSSEATLAMDNYGKRKPKPIVFSESTSDDVFVKKARRVSVELSPSPPHLTDESLPQTPPKRKPFGEMVPSTSHTFPKLSSSTPMRPACSYVDMDSTEHQENRSPGETVNAYGEWLKSTMKHHSSDMQQLLQISAEILRVVSDKREERFVSCQIPVRNNWEFDQFEEKLADEKFYGSMMNLLSKTGAHTVGECTRKVLGLLIGDKYLWKLNWRGVHGRRALSKTNVCKLIMNAVQRHDLPGSDMRIIAEKIQRYIQRSRKPTGDLAEGPAKDAAVQTDEV